MSLGLGGEGIFEDGGSPVGLGGVDGMVCGPEALPCFDDEACVQFGDEADDVHLRPQPHDGDADGLAAVVRGDVGRVSGGHSGAGRLSHQHDGAAAALHDYRIRLLR